MNKSEIEAKVTASGWAWVSRYYRHSVWALITEDERFAWKYGKGDGLIITFAKPGQVKRDGFPA